MDAIIKKITANNIDITIDIFIDISATPIIEYLNPFIIQYRGFSNEINLHDSGSILIDQKTPPSIESGINTNVPQTPTETHVFDTIPTMTPIAPNAQDTTTRKNKDKE